jgi:hypothetical protein
MKRLQIQVDDPTYETLRRLAFGRRQSLAGVIRDLLHEGLKPSTPHASGVRRFSFVGVGDSGEAGRRDRVSERHDEFLGGARW